MLAASPVILDDHLAPAATMTGAEGRAGASRGGGGGNSTLLTAVLLLSAVGAWAGKRWAERLKAAEKGQLISVVDDDDGDEPEADLTAEVGRAKTRRVGEKKKSKGAVVPSFGSRKGAEEVEEEEEEEEASVMMVMDDEQEDDDEEVSIIDEKAGLRPNKSRPCSTKNLRGGFTFNSARQPSQDKLPSPTPSNLRVPKHFDDDDEDRRAKEDIQAQIKARLQSKMPKAKAASSPKNCHAASKVGLGEVDMD